MSERVPPLTAMDGRRSAMPDKIPHYDRVRATVYLLENLPRERAKGRLPGDLTEFDYGSWRYGTAACAGGYMATHDVFRRRGLDVRCFGTPVYPDPRNPDKDLFGYRALAAFLGIDRDTARDWFVRGVDCKVASDVTAQDIADMMRAWLAERGELGRLA